MKTEKNILIAFVLNLSFAIFEFFGGIFTGSVAIISDAMHDLGDAVSIGVSYFLEKKSKRGADSRYTYGYARYSALGSVFVTLILAGGSVLVISSAVRRLIAPTEIKYGGMIVFAVVGVVVNILAARFTHGGGSLGQRAVNLHMIEDALGWVVVLVGAVVMRFTDLAIIDPLMSIALAVFILIQAVRTLLDVIELFLEKTPRGVDVHELAEHIAGLEGVVGVHHIHVWSMDGENAYATMHIVTDAEHAEVKRSVKKELAEHGICHATLELEAVSEKCDSELCSVNKVHHRGHCHGHCRN